MVVVISRWCWAHRRHCFRCHTHAVIGHPRFYPPTQRPVILSSVLQSEGPPYFVLPTRTAGCRSAATRRGRAVLLNVQMKRVLRAEKRALRMTSWHMVVVISRWCWAHRRHCFRYHTHAVIGRPRFYAPNQRPVILSSAFQREGPPYFVLPTRTADVPQCRIRRGRTVLPTCK